MLLGFKAAQNVSLSSSASKNSQDGECGWCPLLNLWKNRKFTIEIKCKRSVSVHSSKSASGASKAINWAIKICWLRSGPVLKYDNQDAENAPTDSRPFIKPVSQAIISCTFRPNACVSCQSRVGLRVSFKAPDNLSMNIFYSAEKSSLLHHTPLFYCRSVPRATAGGILFLASQAAGETVRDINSHFVRRHVKRLQ